MQYSFVAAALIAGASAQYQVAPAPVASSSSAVTSSAAASTSATQAYPVASSSKATSSAVESKTTYAVESKSTPAATYPVAATTGASNGTTPVSYEATKYTTEVVNQYTTFCPGPTTITYGTKTYAVTKPTTLTITDCPGGCTVTKPVYSTSVVQCNGGACPSGKPVPPPTYGNATVPGVPVVPGKPTTMVPAPTGGYPTNPTKATTPGAPVPTAGAGKVAAFGGLAGLVALFAL